MKTIKLTPTNDQEVVNQTATVLKNGGLVVFPSDTVYGLLVDAKNKEAVSKLLAFKERKTGQAISIFVADKTMAEKYVKLNQNAKNVINNLLPGPFTVIAESKHQTDPRLEAENGTLGFRIPDFEPILKLTQTFGGPITATSANLSGRPPHYSIASLRKSLSAKKETLVDLTVDGGKLPYHKPSTVIATTTGQLKTLRAGDILPQTPNSLISHSEEETKHLAQFLATKLIKKCPSRPIVFLLKGELGTGKTIFTKGLAEALKIEEKIVSPTFALYYEYLLPANFACEPRKVSQKPSFPNKNRSGKLLHFDLYRVESAWELEEIGFLDNLESGNIYVVEWAERIPAEMISALSGTAEIILINLRHSGPNERAIEWGISAGKTAA